jgi:integrase
MARMKPPKVPEESPPIRSEKELGRLLKVCEGTTFRDRRDMALVRLFLDTGARRSELANLNVADVLNQEYLRLKRGLFGKRPPKVN